MTKRLLARKQLGLPKLSMLAKKLHDKSNSSPSQSSFHTCESSFDTDVLRSLYDTTMQRTSVKTEKKKALDKSKEGALTTHQWPAQETPALTQQAYPALNTQRQEKTHTVGIGSPTTRETQGQKSQAEPACGPGLSHATHHGQQAANQDAKSPQEPPPSETRQAKPAHGQGLSRAASHEPPATAPATSRPMVQDYAELRRAAQGLRYQHCR